MCMVNTFPHPVLNTRSILTTNDSGRACYSTLSVVADRVEPNLTWEHLQSVKHLIAHSRDFFPRLLVAKVPRSRLSLSSLAEYSEVLSRKDVISLHDVCLLEEAVHYCLT